MGRVNWEEAKIWYLKDTRVSYAILAKYYGVSKPTIQAHATKHGWVKLRQQYSDERVAGLLASAGDSYTEFEARQLKYFKYMQAMAMQHLLELNALREANKIKLHHLVATTASIGRTLTMAIKQERLVLGIQYLPVRHPNDPGPPPPKVKPKEDKPLNIDEIIKDLEKSLRYFKRKKAIIEKSNQRVRELD